MLVMSQHLLENLLKKQERHHCGAGERGDPPPVAGAGWALLTSPPQEGASAAHPSKAG